MEVYINKSDINALLEHHLDDWCGPEYYACSIIQDEIDNMPSADVKAVIHGYWEDASDGDGIVCSVCGTDFCTVIYETDKFDYCPCCGAEMGNGWRRLNGRT